MSARDDGLRKPLLHTGSWYRMGSRQSSMLASSTQIIRESISIFLCVFIVALGPIQFGFTCGYSNPTQFDIINDLGLIISEIGIGLLMLQQLCGINGVLFYSSNIFKTAGISSSKAATFGLGAIQVSSSLTTGSCLLVASAFFLEGVVSKDSPFYSILGILSLVGLVTLVIGFSLGLGPIPWVIMSEILPVNIKSLAGSVATLANWLCASVITMIAPLLMTWSSGGTFIIYALVASFTIVFVTLWVPETQGRTLEEIQWSFR